MAKSAKEKLAVDGTPKLAAKAKASDKHEKQNLSIEAATIESPRPSRKRAGDYFDFGDEADRVADDLAGADGKSSGKAGASKAAKPSKKAKTENADTAAKKGGKKGDADDAKKPKAKKADKVNKDTVIGPSGDTATIPAEVPETADKAKKGKGKKADTVTEPATDTKKSKGKKTETVKEVATDAKKGKGKKKDADDNETLEDRVVADDAKKHKDDAKKEKAKKAADAKKDTVVGPSGDTATVPEQVPETANKAKKGKAAKDIAAVKPKAGEAKATKKDTEKPGAKDQPQSSKTSKKADKEPVKPKETAPKAPPKDKITKGKSAKDSAVVEPKTSTKKSKASTTKGATPADGDAMDQGPFENLLDSTDKGKNPVPGDAKAPKASKGKKDAKQPAKEAATDKSSKKAKDGEAVKPKKAAKDGEAAKPKKATKSKDNKADIPDQAVQPMDLVQEEAALNELSKPDAVPKGKKRKATSDAAVDTVKTNLLDPLSEHAAEAAESANKKQKKSRKSLGETLGGIVNSFTGILGGGTDGKPTTTGSSKKSEGKGKATDANAPQPVTNKDGAEDEDEDGEDDDAPDDQTAALLAGFESDGDDVHPPGDTGFSEGSKIPDLPNSKATAKKLKALKDKDTPGVIYVGRIPHGFYEHEMRTYFSQFGDLNRLRLSRSVQTGHSKHYAFLQFKNEDVANIVAETMDNYLMFGHILKCKVVAPENVHESMWKGANKRFKKVPFNKIAGRELELPQGREVWKKREEKEVTKRAEKAKKTMETVGYAFEGTGIKSVDSVPKRVVAAATEQEIEKNLVTARGEEQAGPVIVSEEVTTTRVQKGGKVVAETVSTKVESLKKRALDDDGDAVASVTKKVKKAKKAVA